MHRRIRALCIGVSSSIITVLAQAVGGEPANPPPQMADIVVTASRQEKLLQNTPDIVQVINRARIEELRPSTTGQLLEYAAGATVSTGTGSGMPDRSVVSLNGLPPNYTLVLVDGVPLVTEHVHTGQNIEFIPPDSIERIEIMRGAGSAQYGADAIGGIVNIITRKCAGTLDANLRAEAGSYSTREAGATLLLPMGGAARLSSFLNWEKSDGLPITAPAHRVGQMEFERLNLMNRVDTDIGDFGKLYASLNWVDYRTLWRDTTMESHLLAPVLGLSGKLSPEMEVAGKLAYSVWDSEINAENDTRLHPEAYMTWRIQDRHTLMAGVDFRRNEFERTALVAPRQEGYGVFVQDEWASGKILSMTAAVRYDKVEDVDSAVSPKLSVLVSPKEDFRIRASYGQGFHAPTLMEMYEEGYGHGGTAYRFGNPDLEPEYSETYGLTVETEPCNALLLALHGFYTSLDDMIVPVYQGPWDEDPTKDVWRRANIKNAKVYGAEATVRCNVSRRLCVEGGYTYTDNEDKDTGRQLPYRPGSSIYAKLVATQPVGGSVDISGFVGVHAAYDREAWNWQPAAGTSRDDPNGLVTPLKDYAKLDAGVTVAFNKNYEAFVRVENILGEDIENLDDAYTVIDGEPVVRVGFSYNLPQAK